MFYLYSLLWSKIDIILYQIGTLITTIPDNLDFHLPPVHLSVVQRGVLYSGCKIFNNLPLYIKSQVGDSKHFMKMAKSFLIEQATCSLDEYFKLSSQ